MHSVRQVDRPIDKAVDIRQLQPAAVELSQDGAPAFRAHVKGEQVQGMIHVPSSSRMQSLTLF